MKNLTIDEALQKLLASLPEEIAERVAAKYADDRDAFVSFLKEITPSEEPGFWANRACKSCYGRGTTGFNHNTNKEVVCACVAKSYQAWVTKHRKAFNKRKEDASKQS